jgi:hypothetical protein
LTWAGEKASAQVKPIAMMFSRGWRRFNGVGREEHQGER